MLLPVSVFHSGVVNGYHIWRSLGCLEKESGLPPITMVHALIGEMLPLSHAGTTLFARILHRAPKGLFLRRREDLPGLISDLSAVVVNFSHF